MRTDKIALTVLLAASVLLPGCPDEQSPAVAPSPAPAPADATAEASTYNPDTRLADASGGEKWDATDRSLVKLPTPADVAAAKSAGDPRVADMEYPNARFDNALDMANMKVLYYHTPDTFDDVADHYAQLPGFKGGTYSSTAAAYSRTLVDGSTVTATITSQPAGGCQIILNVTGP